MLKKLARFIGSDSKTLAFKRTLISILGFKPNSLDVYHLALKHTSTAKTTSTIGIREHNERLEFLGDSVLGVVVAEYLFKKYPFKDEGFLTELRSRIVNGESLSQISIEMGLSSLVKFEGSKSNARSIYGDALEALIAAIYLDKGFKTAQNFILKKIIEQHIDLDELISTTKNYKSKLIEWAHKNNKVLKFQIINEEQANTKKQFEASVSVDEVEICIGFGFSKKKAEQDAEMKACTLLEIIN